MSRYQGSEADRLWEEEAKAHERGYLLTAVASLVGHGSSGALDGEAVKDAPEVVEALFGWALQAVENEDGREEDGSEEEPLFQQERAISRVADALLVAYGIKAVQA